MGSNSALLFLIPTLQSISEYLFRSLTEKLTGFQSPVSGVLCTVAIIAIIYNVHTSGVTI